MTPPGYKTVGDVTSLCPTGSYRAEWKPASEAGSCDLCGDNILSDPTDEITAIDISDYESTTKVFVRASASACCELTPSVGVGSVVLGAFCCCCSESTACLLNRLNSWQP